MADIFKEVDEDLKRDQALELWRKYGRYIIVFAAAVVIATAGIVGWNNYREHQREADGQAFALAFQLIDKGDSAAASAAMADISARGGAYRILAMLQQAAFKQNAGDKPGAVAIYDQIAADDSADKPFRDLATLLSAMASVDKGDGAAIDKKLQPLLAPGSAFRPSAMEIQGLLALKGGNLSAARQVFQQLADDTTTPSGLRQRATQILTWIGEQGGA
ncbi:MAG TPA: tetratricopeptide repeat protein [Dongiaceae bacterium]